MNSQTIRDELAEFVYANFDAQDMDILTELCEIFVQAHSCQLPNGQTMNGPIHSSKYLNLDTVIKFMQNKGQRAQVFDIITEGVHSSVIANATRGKRGGANGNP